MNTVRSLRNHLEMFQQTFTNGLTDASPLAQQPPHIQIPLRLHQLAALHAAREKETSLRIGYNTGSETLFSTFGFVADEVGVGKTLITLGHISQMALEPLVPGPALSNLHPQSSAACFSVYPQQSPTQAPFDSLIVVPHILYRQWQDAIQKQTTLSCCFLKTIRDLDKDSLLGDLRKSHCALISNTLLPQLLQNLRVRQLDDAQWRRVFFDEADSIKIAGTCPLPRASFTWLVSASFSNLLFAGEYYHSYILRQLPQEFLETLHPELRDLLQTHLERHPAVNFFRTQSQNYFQEFLRNQHPRRSFLVVRSTKEFLEKSIQLPPLYRLVVRCQAPQSHHILGQAIPAEVQQMLHAGDIQGALQSLGVANHTPLTLTEAVTAYRNRELDRLRRLLAFKQEEEYATPQAKEAAIKTLETKIKALEDQIQSVQERLQASTKDSCSICFEQAVDAVLTPCCNKNFCGACILEWMTRAISCPLCRSTLHPNELVSIGTPNRAIPQKPRLPKKLDALFQLLEEHPEGRFLVFSRYENSLHQIQEKLSESNTRVTLLHGNKDAIASIISDFSDGSLRVLLLNSQKAAAGIHIPAATHVVLFHKMQPEEEHQILGRAYRLGRTTPLTLVQLLHEQE